MSSRTSSRPRLMAVCLAACLGPVQAQAIVCGEYVTGELDPGESAVHTFVAAAGIGSCFSPAATTST